jgi:predicted MFS family arabinose efflux permease
MIAYAVSGIPMGLATDRVRRFRFLGLGVLVWSAFTAMGGFARNFGQLLAMRVGVGIAESTFFPATMSLLGDLYRTHQRNRAVGLVQLGIPVGITLSFAVGGVITRSHGWRVAFMIALIPGLIVALACLFMREPVRGAGEEHAAVGAARRPGTAWQILRRTPSFWLLALTASLHQAGSFAQAAFIQPMIMRYHAMSVDTAGKALGIVVGSSAIAGLLLGGLLGDKLRRRRADAGMILGAVGFGISVVPLYLAFTRQPGSIAPFFVLYAVAQALVFPFVAYQFTLIQEVVEPALRGTAVAISSLATSLLGGALGPLTTGILSDRFARRMAGGGQPSDALLEPFRGEALRQALFLVPILYGLVAVLLVAGMRVLRRDRASLEQWMATHAAS